MRKFLTSMGLVFIGGLLMYLMDPDRGRSRRARLADQAEARSRDVVDAVTTQAKYQAGVAKGAAHEIADAVTPDSDDYDDEALLQKVRSEAVGPVGASTIEVDVTDGVVTVTGSHEDERSRKRLMKLIERVDGVASIDDQLVKSGQGRSEAKA